MIDLVLSRLIPGTAVAASFVSAASLLIAQGVFNPIADNLERGLGAISLVGVAYLVIRWTRALFKDVQQLRSEEHRAALERERLLIGQIDALTDRLAEVNAQLYEERQLRLSLEQLGIKDRRHGDRN